MITRLLLILLMISIASPSWGVMVVKKKNANNAVDMSRGFEVDSDPAGWTEIDTGGLLDRYSTTQAHTGTHSMSISGGATTEAIIVYDMGAGKTDVSEAFWYYAPTTGGDDATVINALSPNATSGGTPSLRVYFRRSSGVYNFGIRGTTLVYGSVSITTGAWYRVEVDFTQNSTSTITVFNASGTQVDTVSCTANNTAPRYLHYGKFTATGRTDWATGYFDDIGADYTDATTPLWPYLVGN